MILKKGNRALHVASSLWGLDKVRKKLILKNSRSLGDGVLFFLLHQVQTRRVAEQGAACVPVPAPISAPTPQQTRLRACW